MIQDSLGNRMKNNYENRSRHYLVRRTPAILRLDGKAFHSLLSEAQEPFDERFRNCMVTTAYVLLHEIQGSKLAYIQSDEISLLLTDFDRLETDAWFDYNIQKMVSVASGIASAKFIELYGKWGIFDCRAFNVPKEEVTNYFIWRQKDWERNSLNMLCQVHYSHNELEDKNSAERHEMLHKVGVNWADLPEKYKNGTILFRDEMNFVSEEHYMFTEHRNLVEDFLYKILDK